MTSVYDSMLFLLIFKARRDITFDVDGPASPVHAKTRELKVLFATSIIRCWYFNLSHECTYNLFVVMVDNFDFVTNVSPEIFRSGVKASGNGFWSLNAGIR